jgi:hypothetical protein
MIAVESLVKYNLLAKMHDEDIAFQLPVPRGLWACSSHVNQGD